MQNSGETVSVMFTMPAPGLFPGYGLSKTMYNFSNAHFHWGKEDRDGSEHRIEGQAFSMELHLVHFNSKFTSVQEAVASGESNALAVVGIFLQAGDSYWPNKALAPIVNNLKKVRNYTADFVRIDESLNLAAIIPQVDELLYSYQGSLTTPACSEQVSWFVFQSPVMISKSQVQAFRRVNDEMGNPILENNRPVQKVNNRRIDVVVVNGY